MLKHMQLCTIIARLADVNLRKFWQTMSVGVLLQNKPVIVTIVLRDSSPNHTILDSRLSKGKRLLLIVSRLQEHVSKNIF